MVSRFLFLLAVQLLAGCATQTMSGDQLARVAKDWSLGIRASQVIPVYPLTEDVQPRHLPWCTSLSEGVVNLLKQGRCDCPLNKSSGKVIRL